MVGNCCPGKRRKIQVLYSKIYLFGFLHCSSPHHFVKLKRGVALFMVCICNETESDKFSFFMKLKQASPPFLGNSVLSLTSHAEDPQMSIPSELAGDLFFNLEQGVELILDF